eukprot:CAMPEP_0206022812 /NCGR_PEP_ID=MMETSP1464-20131121/35311_1 /ASSEMBLY_ACC=CAM_ASM_001124 /TAXON_ID=119497 /ORGANISM="Exanthemachrysis gayraliae, Strain RCC1523" /LENGTH=51 /DNA_ID=CAMNT_0053396785 /DNA_START=292 /DNA_END=444 /DNA_ORIENTATION=+
MMSAPGGGSCSLRLPLRSPRARPAGRPSGGTSTGAPTVSALPASRRGRLLA